ncbi:MAG: cobalamin B12-binding domain-containing protein [Nitrospinae bacterium]|nr:cobalamin B12-binding domain-containing protein [Nitrospinota bacterium]
MDQLTELARLIQHGENKEAVSCAERLLAESYGVDQVIESASKGVAALRNKCTVENFQLLDVLLACRAMVEVVDECLAAKLKAQMDKATDELAKVNHQKRLKTIVIGTIQGDVHDLGKHVVATLCRFNNFNVVNLGKDVPVDAFIEAVEKEKADFVGVSSLMTACLPKMRQIKPALLSRGLGLVKVVGGGSAAQQSSAESLGLDYLARDAFDGLDYFCRNGGHS